MVNYLEILRLKSIGCSTREIASSVKSSHNTVRTVIDLAQKNNLSYPLDSDVTNADLEKVILPRTEKCRCGTQRARLCLHS